MKPEETTEVDTIADSSVSDFDTDTAPSTSSSTTKTDDSFPIQGIDYIEFYVGNAKQAAHFYRTAMGFNVTAYAGPETGVRDRASYVLEQGKIRFVLTAPMLPEGEISEHVLKHSDGVKDIALRVPDVVYS